MIPTEPSRQGTKGGPGVAEKLALCALILWLVLAGLVWGLLPGRMSLAGVLVPPALLVLGYVQARHLRLLRHEAAELRAELGRMAHDRAAADAAVAPVYETAPQPATFASSAASPHPDPAPPSTTAPLFRTAQRTSPPAPQPQPPPASPAFASRRDPAMALPATGDNTQGSLPLGAEMDAPVPPLPIADFITALNFPETPDDTDGFRALRRALKHPPTAPLIQAAQDVLTLMSQMGLYMDDLSPDHARPELWRRFAEGERGGVIGALGGIRDRESLATSATAMREDPVFRDATHHFLRRFDQMLASRTADMDDSSLIHLAETRTARAFMLLGRVAGMFD